MGEAPLILVVDDQVGIRRLVETVCLQAGYRVATAGNGREALAVAAQEHPGLIILDLRMPVMDGIETLRALRVQWPDLPVILMTAAGEAEDLRAVAVRAVIRKPFDVFALRDLVLEMLG